ncbi:MAG: DNA replication/repair protein RecF [Alphaproteobacteria bacterium]|nr:DNA replication/repair protein RecF [Alphaproteobacteria bacterium]
MGPAFVTSLEEVAAIRARCVVEAPAAPRPAAHAVTRLQLTRFRSYERLDLGVDARPVVLVGANGAGKTNILEALSWLQPGRGLRGATLADAERRAPSPAPLAQGWAVAAQATGPDGAVRLGSGLDAATGRRAVRIDGEVAGPMALSRHMRLAWLTPAMDRLFLEGPGGRREFLDRLTIALEPDHAVRLAAYEKAMRERRALLETGAPDGDWLAAAEARMAQDGVAVTLARLRTVAALDGASRDRAFPHGFPSAELCLVGGLEARLAQEDPSEVEGEFRSRLAASRARDAAAGRTLEGPHRSDLRVTHAEKAMPAGEASTGEQKALLVGLVLAFARLGRTMPVMLLDEAAAHLDPQRRRALCEAILALGMQAWLTGTDAALFSAFEGRAQLFTVEDGALAPRAA